MTKTPRILSTKQAKAVLSDGRAKALAAMTKPELVKALQAAERKIVKLERQLQPAPQHDEMPTRTIPPAFPWNT